MILSAFYWLEKLLSKTNAIKQEFVEIYGNHPAVIEERLNSSIELVKQFIKTYDGEKNILLTRAPARVNLMGRHIDHQGGFINTVAINKEILIAASSRNDSFIRVHNIHNKQFPSFEINPNEIFDVTSYSDWKSFVKSKEVLNFNNYKNGDWSFYILAVFYRLQLYLSDKKLKGLDCFVSGNIPVGSGLSSSSAIGVAFAKALLELNNIDISDKLLIELTGESELFLGFHGGKGDQAAIISAKKGIVTKIGFYPFHIANNTQFPDELELIIAYSGTSAKKSGPEKEIFNQRVACYKLAFRKLQKIWAPALEAQHIRDLTPERLKLTTNIIIQGLYKLPNRPSRTEITEFFDDEEKPYIKDIFQSHNDPGEYNLIGTILFGISECVRSESFHQILEQKDFDKMSKLISVSHNGDRLQNKDQITDITKNEEPLTHISGYYGCSTENIDQMVDIANNVPGTIGAQLAGAGMGGNIVVLVKAEAVENVVTALNDKYYVPNNIPYDAHICIPISGASILGKQFS